MCNHYNAGKEDHHIIDYNMEWVAHRRCIFLLLIYKKFTECVADVQIREVTVAQGNWCLPPVQRSYSKKTPRRRRLNMDILQFSKNL
jgi:hypothetical protein